MQARNQSGDQKDSASSWRERCVDIETEYGWRFRVEYEDDDATATQDAWRKLIRCKHGDIGPAGATTLIACTNSDRNAAVKSLTDYTGESFRDAGGGAVRPRRLKDGVPGCLVADASDGISVVFDIKDAEFYFKVMGAKKR